MRSEVPLELIPILDMAFSHLIDVAVRAMCPNHTCNNDPTNQFGFKKYYSRDIKFHLLDSVLQINRHISIPRQQHFDGTTLSLVSFSIVNEPLQNNNESIQCHTNGLVQGLLTHIWCCSLALSHLYISGELQSRYIIGNNLIAWFQLHPLSIRAPR